jgi:hypothetical protein
VLRDGLGIDIQPGQQIDERPVLVDRDPVLAGEGQDAIGEVAIASRDEPRRAVDLRVV